MPREGCCAQAAAGAIVRSDVVGRTMYARGKPFRVIGVVPDYLVHMTGDRVAE